MKYFQTKGVIEMSSDTVREFSDKELREEVFRLAKPLEEAAFAAGKRAAIAEQHEALRESAMLKVAKLRGLTPSDAGATGATAVKGKSPEDLAKRANELQLQALAEGRELTNIEAVTAAYTEAGIAWK
jgi:hypothetical protein